MKKAAKEDVGIYGSIMNAMQRLVVQEFVSGDEMAKIAAQHPGLTVEAIEFLIRGAMLKEAKVQP